MVSEFEGLDDDIDFDIVGDVPRVKEHKDLAMAWDRLANTPDGEIVLRHILALTGYKDKLMTFNQATSELNPYATIYNLSRRDLWFGIQQMLTPIQLQRIEHPEV